MTGVAAVLNFALAVTLWLLVLRLLILNWARGGAILALLIAFLVLLLAYDIVIAAIAAVLMLLFVPTLARSQLGSALMRLLVTVTDPVIELVRRGTGGRIDGGPAILIAALFVLALRVISYVTLSS